MVVRRQEAHGGADEPALDIGELLRPVVLDKNLTIQGAGVGGTGALHSLSGINRVLGTVGPGGDDDKSGIHAILNSTLVSYERLPMLATFMAHSALPNGEIPLIGDILTGGAQPAAAAQN